MSQITGESPRGGQIYRVQAPWWCLHTVDLYLQTLQRQLLICVDSLSVVLTDKGLQKEAE